MQAARCARNQLQPHVCVKLALRHVCDGGAAASAGLLWSMGVTGALLRRDSKNGMQLRHDNIRTSSAVSSIHDHTVP